MMMTITPGFRRWLRILLPPIAVVFGWIFWGDVELRRFQEAVAAVEGRTPRSVPSLPREDGSRFYAAAAVLADAPDLVSVVQTAGTVRAALMAGAPPPAATAQAVDDILRENEPTLAAVDRAAGLPLTTVRPRFAVLRSVPV